MAIHKFFVNKTGLDLFDAFRAYGLALAIKGFKSGDIKIEDFGPAYIVQFEGNLPSEPDSQIFGGDAWQKVFQTFRERKDAKGKHHPKDIIRGVLVSDFVNILQVHQNPYFAPQIGHRMRGGIPLYQTIDVAAAKGFRETKLCKTYHEGTQIQADKYSGAIAYLGAAHFGYWQKSADFIMSLVPNPSKVSVLSARQVQKDLANEKICNISSSVALAHYSVRLMILLQKRQVTGSEVVYDSVLFNVMRQTRQQPKPAGGGRYELDFLRKVAQEREALTTMDKIFNMGFIGGIKQDMAMALADFVLDSSLENLQKYQNLHLRAYLNKEKIPYWNDRTWGEVMKHVQSV
jgi:hypothetical protein